MRDKKIIFLNLLLFCLSPTIFAGEFDGKPVKSSHEERSRIEAREKEIDIEKKKIINELKQREGKEKSERDIKEEESKNTALKELLAEEHDILTTLEQFGGTSEEKDQINEKKQELVKEKVALQERVNKLNQELNKLGVSIDSADEKVDSALDEKLNNIISLSERFKTRLKAFLKEVKANIAESVFGNNAMAAKAREDLDALYKKLNDPLNQAANARAWGKLLPELADRIAKHKDAFDIYSKHIDAIAEKIDIKRRINDASSKTIIRDLEIERNLLERRAVENILLDLTVDFRMLEQQLEDPQIINNDALKKEFAEQIKKQITDLRLVRQGINEPWHDTRSTIERNETEGRQKKFLATLRSDTNFKNMIGKSTLNDVEYRNLLKKLVTLENFDFSFPFSINDLYFIIGTLYSSYSGLEEGLINKRTLLLREISKHPNNEGNINKLRSIENELSRIQDKTKTWGEAYHAEFQREGVNNTEIAKTIEEANKDAKTKISEITFVNDEIKKSIELLKNELVKDNLGDRVVLARKQLELGKQMDAALKLFDAADPSRDGVNLIRELRDVYGELISLIKKQIEIANNAGVIAPAQSEITQIYIDALNKLNELNRQISIYNNFLTISSGTKISFVNQVSRSNVERMINDAWLKEPLKSYIRIMRDLTGKRKFSPVSEEIPTIGQAKDAYQKVLFSTNIPAQQDQQEEDAGDYGY